MTAKPSVFFPGNLTDNHSLSQWASPLQKL